MILKFFFITLLFFLINLPVQSQYSSRRPAQRLDICESMKLPDGQGGCCRVSLEALEMIMIPSNSGPRVSDLVPNNKGACCLEGYDCPHAEPEYCEKKGATCGFDIPDEKKVAGSTDRRFQIYKTKSQAIIMGAKAGVLQRALRGMTGNNPNLENFMNKVESLKEQFSGVSNFDRSFKASYESAMKLMDDQTAQSEALKLYQQLRGFK